MAVPPSVATTPLFDRLGEARDVAVAAAALEVVAAAGVGGDELVVAVAAVEGVAAGPREERVVAGAAVEVVGAVGPRAQDLVSGGARDRVAARAAVEEDHGLIRESLGELSWSVPPPPQTADVAQRCSAASRTRPVGELLEHPGAGRERRGPATT